MSDSGGPPHGGICYVEIPAPDLERATAFYGEVFGWKGEPSGEGYVMFQDGLVGGGFDRSRPVADTGGPILVLAVDDIPATLARIEAAGGTTVKPRTEIGGGYGYYAYFRDPNGNQMGIWSRT